MTITFFILFFNLDKPLEYVWRQVVETVVKQYGKINILKLSSYHIDITGAVFL